MKLESTKPLLTARDVHVRLGRNPALGGARLTAPGNSVTALLGRNGAGKSTLLDCCIGLRRPDRGSIELLGADPAARGWRVRQDVGYVEADPIFDHGERVETLLRFHRALRPGWCREAEKRLVSALGVPLRSRVRDLSRGLRTKLALLIALAPSPRLLVLDEPFDGLDVGARDEILAELVRQVDGDRAIVLATHDLDEVERIADRVCVLDGGRTVFEGTPEGLRAAGREKRGEGIDVIERPPLPDLKEAFLMVTATEDES